MNLIKKKTKMVLFFDLFQIRIYFLFHKELKLKLLNITFIKITNTI